MKRSKRTFTAEFKARVALEAIKELKTVSELAQDFQLVPNQISMWKREFLSNAVKVFDNGTPEADRIKKLEKEKEDLVQQIGQLTVDNNWLKKKLL
jgi:transposase-like protein